MADGYPTVTVFMPTFRRCASGLTERAIQSVRNQTYCDWEMFVIDDGSVDCTAELVARHVADDSRITGIRHESNSGLPALRIDQVMQRARGQYFAFMFDDDLWYPDALRVLVQAMEHNPDWAMAYGNVLFPYRDADGVEHNDRILGAEPPQFDIGLLEGSNYIANVAVILSRNVLDEVGTFDPHILIRRWCDWDLWLRIARDHRIGHVNELMGEATGLLTTDSLGLTAEMDYELVRQYMATDRTHRLLPGNVLNYPVDDLSILEPSIVAGIRASAARMFADFYRSTGRIEDADAWAKRALSEST